MFGCRNELALAWRHVAPGAHHRHDPGRCHSCVQCTSVATAVGSEICSWDAVATARPRPGGGAWYQPEFGQPRRLRGGCGGHNTVRATTPMVGLSVARAVDPLRRMCDQRSFRSGYVEPSWPGCLGRTIKTASLGAWGVMHCRTLKFRRTSLNQEACMVLLANTFIPRRSVAWNLKISLNSYHLSRPWLLSLFR